MRVRQLTIMGFKLREYLQKQLCFPCSLHKQYGCDLISTIPKHSTIIFKQTMGNIKCGSLHPQVALQAHHLLHLAGLEHG